MVLRRGSQSRSSVVGKAMHASGGWHPEKTQCNSHAKPPAATPTSKLRAMLNSESAASETRLPPPMSCDRIPDGPAPPHPSRAHLETGVN